MVFGFVFLFLIQSGLGSSVFCTHFLGCLSDPVWLTRHSAREIFCVSQVVLAIKGVLEWGFPPGALLCPLILVQCLVTHSLYGVC